MPPKRTASGPAPPVVATAGSSNTARADASSSPLVTLQRSYLAHTPARLRLLDAFMAFLVLSGVLQFVYCIAISNFPLNSFIAGCVRACERVVQARDVLQSKESMRHRSGATVALLRAARRLAGAAGHTASRALYSTQPLTRFIQLRLDGRAVRALRQPAHPGQRGKCRRVPQELARAVSGGARARAVLLATRSHADAGALRSAFGDFLFASVVLHFFVVNFLG
jgi:hypothetical protein